MEPRHHSEDPGHPEQAHTDAGDGRGHQGVAGAPHGAGKNLHRHENKVKEIKLQYRNFKSSLDKKLRSGEITEDEYFTMLAEDPITNTYYVSVIYGGTADFARIQDKLTLISIVAIVIYAFAAILLLFNIFNLVFNAKFIYITNAQASSPRDLEVSQCK